MADDLDPATWSLLKSAASEVDPVPPEVTILAEAALNLVGDLARAELVFDTRVDGSAAAMRSGHDAVSIVEFEATTCVVEVTINPGPIPSAVGQLDPPLGSVVVVETPNGEHSRTETTSDGAFSLPQLPEGPLRLVVLANGERVLVTSWALLS